MGYGIGLMLADALDVPMAAPVINSSRVRLRCRTHYRRAECPTFALPGTTRLVPNENRGEHARVS